MDILEQFIRGIAYKFPKGYPDMNDPKDLRLLENELKNIGIDLNELNLHPHYTTRKKERKTIINIPNLSQQMIGDRDFQETKTQIIDSIEQELLERLSIIEKTRTIPLSFKETVIYKVLQPILLSGGEKYDLLFTVESSDDSGVKSYTDKFYYVIIIKDEIKTLMGSVGNDSDIEEKSLAYLKRNNIPLKPTRILTFGDFEYVISLDEKPKGKTLIDPKTLPYTVKKSYRVGTDFTHKDYGTGKVVAAASSGTRSGEPDSRGMVEWVEVDFKKPYVAGGQFKTTRIIKNVYTSLSPDLDAGVAE